MLKKGDLIFNIFLRQMFVVVTADVVYHNKMYPSNKRNTLGEPKYKQWRYRVQPMRGTWEWKSVIKTSVLGGSPYVYWHRNCWGEDEQPYMKSIPTRMFSEDMGVIYPGTFEEKGFRLPTKAMRILYERY